VNSIPAPVFEYAWKAAVVCACAVILLPTLAFPFDYDQGMLHYVAWSAVEGLWPYRDVWDTAFPGGILIHAVSIKLVGNLVVGVRAIDLVWQLATTLALLVCGTRLAGSRAGAYAALSYAMIYRATGAYHTAQRDSFLVLPLLLAVLSGLRFLEDARRRHLITAGLCLGIVTLFRPTYALMAVAAAVCVALGKSGAPSWSRFRDAAWLSAVAASPLVAFFAVVLLTGNAGPFADLFTALSTIYPGLEVFSFTRVIENALNVVPALVWAGAGAALLSMPRGGWLFCATAALCLVVRVWESKGFTYQYWPLVATLLPLAGSGWSTITERATSALQRLPIPHRVLAPAALGLVLLVQYADGPQRGYGAVLKLGAAVEERYASFLGPHTDQAALAAHIHQNSKPTDKVQLWGPLTGVLAAIERRSATRFTDPFLLFCEEGGKMQLFSECTPPDRAPLQLAFRKEIVDELRARPPLYIAAHYEQGSLAVNDGPSVAPDLPELREILDRGYVREATFGRWSAFRRIDER